MSRLEKPFHYHVLWATGDLILRAELDLLLKDGQGNWCLTTFRVDSATDMTTVPAYDAEQVGLPMPVNPSPVKHQQTGLVVRSGYIRCKVVGMDQTEYAFPCYFLGDPNTPPNPGAPPASIPRYLLGISGVVDKLRLIFDGTPTPPHAPYGNLIVEKK